MRAYLDLLNHVMTTGVDADDRTGVGTRSAFGYQYSVDLAEGFPLLTTKTVHWRSVVGELLWFLSGSTSNDDLNARGVTIWDEWATAEQAARFDRLAGDLGPIYGHQWRNFGATRRPDGTYEADGVDQIRRVVDSIRTDPSSRRHVVSAWNPLESDDVALPPCHTLFQFSVQQGRLHALMYQRSADCFLGVPFNLASYALLQSMVAHVTGLVPGRFVHSIGDAHIYRNHFDQVERQLARAPGPLPSVVLDPSVTDIDGFGPHHVELRDYRPAGRIPAPVAV